MLQVYLNICKTYFCIEKSRCADYTRLLHSENNDSCIFQCFPHSSFLLRFKVISYRLTINMSTDSLSRIDSLLFSSLISCRPFQREPSIVNAVGWILSIKLLVMLKYERLGNKRKAWAPSFVIRLLSSFRLWNDKIKTSATKAKRKGKALDIYKDMCSAGIQIFMEPVLLYFASLIFCWW